jgi:tRNA-splicing endonuclease subunit Sen34
MATDPDTERIVRISKIAGRYLVFDLQDVVYLRRHHNICAVFVGTMPQNPTQNIFMGLPVELLAEEASVLVNKGAAYIADDAVEHLSRLSAMDASSRKAYLQSLKTQRRKAQATMDEERAARSAEAKAKHLGARARKQQVAEPAVSGAPVAEEGLFDTAPQAQSSPVPVSTPTQKTAAAAPGITPGTSAGLVDGEPALTAPDAPEPRPLLAHLNSKGYYITPGLRFGGDYSVYPGDPFRFHAHFMATSYGWDEEITMLDLVASGRLATAVKKGYMLGGQKPRTEDGDNAGHLVDGGEVRAFCMEWAGM